MIEAEKGASNPMDNRPDLSTLELVETKIKDTLLLMFLNLCITGLLIGPFVYMLIVYSRNLGSGFLIAVVGVLILVVVALWIPIRVLWVDYFWQIDDRGVFARNRFRKRFIAWPDIVDVSITKTTVGSVAIRLRSNTKIIKISVQGLLSSDQGDRFIASLWQYFRKYDKGGGVELTEASSSLWDEIPDELPREMEWKSRRSAFRRTLGNPWMPILPLLSVLAILPLIAKHRYLEFELFVVWFCTIAVTAIVISRHLISVWLRTSNVFMLYEDHFEAKFPIKKANIRWNDLTYARWRKEPNAIRPHGMILGSSNPRTEVFIPFDPKDEASYKLMLALIRRTRTAKHAQALPVPSELRNLSSKELWKSCPWRENDT